jgi:hypothetical protein
VISLRIRGGRRLKCPVDPDEGNKDSPRSESGRVNTYHPDNSDSTEWQPDRHYPPRAGGRASADACAPTCLPARMMPPPAARPRQAWSYTPTTAGSTRRQCQ